MWPLALLLLLFTVVDARRHFPPPLRTAQSDLTYTWDTYFYTAKLDNFNFVDQQTFQMKYLVNLNWYKAGGPMFFYTGNEGTVEGFANATGIMFDLAPQFNAALVFAEHRFYDVSMPNPKNYSYDDPVSIYKEAYSNVSYLQYQSSEQALADYAALITYLKSNSSGQPVSFPADTQVIAFGGSYGGMLSAWFRIKYPHITVGAYASSAPVRYFNGANVDWGGFDQITTQTFDKGGCDNNVIAAAWNATLRLANTPEGCDYLNKVFSVNNKSLITSSQDALYLIAYIREGIEYMAMTDYPYPTDFLDPMPGWPVKTGCSLYLPKGGNITTDEEIAQAMANLISIYFNYQNSSTYSACLSNACYDPDTDNLGTPLGWPWQECTEIIIEMCSRGGSNDFFWNQCQTPPLDEMYEYCNAQFTPIGWTKGMLQENAVPLEYGLTFEGASNIIMTNGELDPWRSGGLLSGNPSRGLFTATIKNSAHHLDLRQPNTCDPSNLPFIRYQVVQIFNCWLSGDCPDGLNLVDGDSSVPENIACTDIVNGYPWGITKGASSLLSFAALFILALVQ